MGTRFPESVKRVWGEPACRALEDWLIRVGARRKLVPLPEVVRMAWGEEVTAEMLLWLEALFIEAGVLQPRGEMQDTGCRIQDTGCTTRDSV